MLTAAAWGLAGLLVVEGIATGSLASAADPARSTHFTTLRLEGARKGPNLPPRYVLSGKTDSEREVLLQVSREVYLRAAPGARYTVVPTGDGVQPYLLELEAQPPMWHGPGWGVSVLALTALVPLGLWTGGVALPLLRGRTPEMWAAMSRRGLTVFVFLVVAAAAWWLRAH